MKHNGKLSKIRRHIFLKIGIAMTASAQKKMILITSECKMRINQIGFRPKKRNHNYVTAVESVLNNFTTHEKSCYTLETKNNRYRTVPPSHKKLNMSSSFNVLHGSRQI